MLYIGYCMCLVCYYFNYLLLIQLQNDYLDFSRLKVNWYVYSLDSDGTSTQTETDDDGQEICLAVHLTLPSKELHTLWENLYYENNIKENVSFFILLC